MIFKFMILVVINIIKMKKYKKIEEDMEEEIEEEIEEIEEDIEEVVYITPRSKGGMMRSASIVKIRYVDIENLLNKNLTMDEAAKRLEVSRTAFRNVCRKLGFKTWPYKKKKKVIISTEEDDKNNPYNLEKNYIESYVKIDLNQKKGKVTVF